MDVSWLRERGADVNRGDRKSGKTPLHVAAGYAKHIVPVLLLAALGEGAVSAPATRMYGEGREKKGSSRCILRPLKVARSVF